MDDDKEQSKGELYFNEWVVRTEKSKQEAKIRTYKEEKQDTFFGKNIGQMVVVAVILFFLGIFAYIWFAPSSTPQECEYTDIGCYPNDGNKFGQ